MEAGVHERDLPVVDVALHELQLRSAAGEHEVVRDGLLVLKEVVLDHIGLVAETQDEVLMTEVGIVLHHVPKDRARPNGYHRLRYVVRITSQAHPRATAEQNYFHGS